MEFLHRIIDNFKIVSNNTIKTTHPVIQLEKACSTPTDTSSTVHASNSVNTSNTNHISNLEDTIRYALYTDM